MIVDNPLGLASMPFAIRPDPETAGSVYAYLFENARAGVPRDLYWSVTVPCMPVKRNEEEFECSITCEWLAWPVRDWKQLHGMGLSTATNPALVECSLYLAEHHPVRLERLELGSCGNDPRFRVSLEGTFDIEGFDELDGMGLRFSIESTPRRRRCRRRPPRGLSSPAKPDLLKSEIKLEGLVVVPGNLFPKPQDELEVLQALKPYAALAAFSEPVLDRFRYVLAPATSET